MEEKVKAGIDKIIDGASACGVGGAPPLKASVGGPYNLYALLHLKDEYGKEKPGIPFALSGITIGAGDLR